MKNEQHTAHCCKNNYIVIFTRPLFSSTAAWSVSPLTAPPNGTVTFKLQAMVDNVTGIEAKDLVMKFNSSNDIREALLLESLSRLESLLGGHCPQVSEEIANTYNVIAKQNNLEPSTLQAGTPSQEGGNQ